MYPPRWSPSTDTEPVEIWIWNYSQHFSDDADDDECGQYNCHVLAGWIGRGTDHGPWDGGQDPHGLLKQFEQLEVLGADRFVC